MTAEVGQCVGNGGECVIYRKALYTAARAFALLTVHGNDNGRFSVFSAKPCGNYSYYALVPIFTRHHYDARIFFVGTALYFRYRLLCYLVFNAVTFFIVSVYCFCKLCGIILVITQQKAKRSHGGAHSACGVYARRQGKGYSACAELLAGNACRIFKSLYSLAAARIYTLQALIHESAVLFFQGNDVGKGSYGNKVGKLIKQLFFAVALYGANRFKCYAHTRPIAKRYIAVRSLRVNHGNSFGKLSALLMVVCYNKVHRKLLCGLRGVKSRDAVIDGDYKRNTAFL